MTAPGPAAGDDTVSRLAEALNGVVTGPWDRQEALAALAPVVADLIERAAREAAAAAVRQAFVDAAGEAVTGSRVRPFANADWLLDFGRSRADALRRGEVRLP